MTTELVSILEECARQLRAANAPHWAAWLEKDARELREGDFHGIEHFLGAFGGAGSLTEAGYGNSRIDAALSRAHDLAEQIRAEHLRSGST